MNPKFTRNKREDGPCKCGCGKIVDRSKNPSKEFFSNDCIMRETMRIARLRKEVLDAAGGDYFFAGL